MKWLLGIFLFVFAVDRPRFSEFAVLPPTEKKWQELESHFAQSSAFVRGEIEQEATANAVFKYTEFALAKQDQMVKAKQYSDAQKSLAKWFKMASDLAYEEATLKGLYASRKIRALLLDQIEKWATTSSPIEWIKELRQGLNSASAPWPVDRVVVGEGKRLANPALFPLIDTAARLLQKNPYQSFEKAVRGKAGAAARDISEVQKVWKDQDVQAMREELTRLSRIKLKLAAVEYELKHGKAPSDGQDLVKAGLLSSLPIDYQTGRPMSLENLK